MAIVTLPLQPSNPSYRVGVTLAGVQYLLDMRWNARDAAHYMDILDETGDPIRTGIKVVLGTFLGQRSVDRQAPYGLLVAVDTSGQGVDAGIDDMGARVVVKFYGADDTELIWGE